MTLDYEITEVETQAQLEGLRTGEDDSKVRTGYGDDGWEGGAEPTDYDPEDEE